MVAFETNDMNPRREKPAYIDAVSVCDGYADMLAVTLPLNRPHIRDFIIVTSRGDVDTQRIAAQHDCRVVICERFESGIIPEKYQPQSRLWNKGAAINDGMAALRDDAGWVLIHDSDIIFTARVMQAINRRLLNVRRLYGVQRGDCRTAEQLERWRANPDTVARFPKVRSMPGVGYFQLFHVDAPALKDDPHTYTEEFGFAGISDYRFLQRFNSVVHLPCKAIHLYHGEHREQWFGRVDNGVRWDSEVAHGVA